MNYLPVPKIIHSKRSSISLQVTKKGELLIKAPLFVPNFVIQKFMDSKKDWIENALKKIQNSTPIIKEYKVDEEFLFLGNKYFLTFYSGIEIITKEDRLLFPKVLMFRIEKELKNWYQKKARDTISKRVQIRAKEMKTSYKILLFSDTKSKWGTCGPDNSLQFNWRLIMAPLMVLDYVVIHELAHTIEKNHGRGFWNKVSIFTPAYKQHRKWLNENAKLLMF